MTVYKGCCLRQRSQLDLSDATWSKQGQNRSKSNADMQSSQCFLGRDCLQSCLRKLSLSEASDSYTETIPNRKQLLGTMESQCCCSCLQIKFISV